MTTEIPEKYLTESGRLASFQSAQPLSKRRASTASSRAPKSLKWPHAFLEPEKLAAAGFYHYPTQESPDNVVCFHCTRSMCGWEEEDDPFVEHLKLSPQCGWAIVASIEAKDSETVLENPLSARMIEARKSTFGDRWPHEGKKGWKCKVKQLVDAGWIYKPTTEYDDFAACVYCGLGLDGWEPNDKPMNEHFNRVPNCPFFVLINNSQQSPAVKKSIKAKKSRVSKASRLSTQSTFTTTSEAPSFTDLPAEEDDSIVTTATNATVTSQGGRKMAKAKKTYGKGRKTKSKIDEPVEKAVAPEPEDDDFEVKVEQKHAATRGKKRKSENIKKTESVVDFGAPPAKRRTTRTRGSIATSSSIAVPEEQEPENPSEGRTKGRMSTLKASRKASTASTASKATVRMDLTDEAEIDKMLQEDLERSLVDDKVVGDSFIATTGRKSRSGNAQNRASTAATRKATRGSKITKDEFAMFSIENVEVDDNLIETELEALEIEESKLVPKVKSTKLRQTRKVSAKKQVATKPATDAEAELLMGELAVSGASNLPQVFEDAKPSSISVKADVIAPGIDIDMKDHDNSGNETDASMTSQSTVVRGTVKRRGSALKKGKVGKKTMKGNIEDIIQKGREFGLASKEHTFSNATIDLAGGSENDGASQLISADSSLEPVTKASNTKHGNSKGKGKATQDTAQLDTSGTPNRHSFSSTQQQSQQMRATTPKSSQLSTKNLTPSPSPQSSDAENHPPSSKPSTIRPTPSHQVSRVPLAASTPTMSPSKRNIVAGLQSSLAWTAVDLEEIFLKSPGQNKSAAFSDNVFADTLARTKKGDLTSPEKRMTVEEWILFNASLAEEKLKAECERMVGIFEREGGKAMRVLEGVKCLE